MNEGEYRDVIFTKSKVGIIFLFQVLNLKKFGLIALKNWSQHPPGPLRTAVGLQIDGFATRGISITPTR